VGTQNTVVLLDVIQDSVDGCVCGEQARSGEEGDVDVRSLYSTDVSTYTTTKRSQHIDRFQETHLETAERHWSGVTSLNEVNHQVGGGWNRLSDSLEDAQVLQTVDHDRISSFFGVSSRSSYAR